MGPSEAADSELTGTPDSMCGVFTEFSMAYPTEFDPSDSVTFDLKERGLRSSRHV